MTDQSEDEFNHDDLVENKVSISSMLCQLSYAVRSVRVCDQGSTGAPAPAKIGTPGPGQNSAGDFKLKFVKFFLLLSYNCQDSGNLSKTKN
jgi:hypothetical protein